MKLTDLAIRQLAIPEQGQKTYWEQGLGVRVSQGGSKTFVAKVNNRQTTLGRYPDMTLKSARQAFLKTKTIETTPKRLSSLSEARTAYLEECERKNRPATVHVYRNYLMKVDRERLTDVRKEDIDLSSAHAVTTWKVFFNWCMRHELVDRNPFTFETARYEERSRFLTDDELRAVYAYDWPPYSDYIKLSILTGQRIGQWQDYTVTDDTIVFPASIMKGKREHIIPLMPMTASLLPVAPFGGWSKAKKRMDEKTGVTGYRVHDLRRTFSTTMASLQVPLHVTEAILDHRSGSISGVAATYNRYNYLKEMREALALYERHIQTVTA